MRCSKAQNLISLAMDESLAEPEGIALEHHLAACPDCVTYRQDLSRCREMLRETEMAPSASFEWKVQLGIQRALRESAAADTAGPRRSFWLPVGLSAALSAALVLAVGVALLGSEGGPADPGSSESIAPVGPSRVAQATSPHRFQGEGWLLDRSGRLTGPDGAAARADWRSGPASLQGQITAVGELHMGMPLPVKSMRLGYDGPSGRSLSSPAPDSLETVGAGAEER